VWNALPDEMVLVSSVQCWKF